jgi:hypothetical protein
LQAFTAASTVVFFLSYLALGLLAVWLKKRRRNLVVWLAVAFGSLVSYVVWVGLQEALPAVERDISVLAGAGIIGGLTLAGAQAKKRKPQWTVTGLAWGLVLVVVFVLRLGPSMMVGFILTGAIPAPAVFWVGLMFPPALMMVRTLKRTRFRRAFVWAAIVVTVAVVWYAVFGALPLYLAMLEA